jgi:membrane-bound ClpP family serine protease
MACFLLTTICLCYTLFALLQSKHKQQQFANTQQEQVVSIAVNSDVDDTDTTAVKSSISTELDHVYTIGTDASDYDIGKQLFMNT